ncbi:MAG: M48 family metalloprotease [Desulfobacteraceae bacterium]|nr:M48 family metalloprotease [Desulfobacteraceae bacterium]
MYNQLIYFIVVLLLFSLQSDSAKAPLPSAPLSDALSLLMLFGAFAFSARTSFVRILRAANAGASLAALTRAYYRAEARLSIAALGFLTIYLYLLDLRLYLLAIPGFVRFLTISGLCGILIYLLHLAVVWFWGHPVYQIVHGSAISRARFVKGYLSFSSVILVPWFLVSSVTDLLQLIRLPFASTEYGHIALTIFALVGFVLLGPWLMVRMWGCEPLPSDYQAGELEEFCRKHRFRSGGFRLWPIFGGEMLTAGVVGILPRVRYILITSGLLRVLDISELKAVVAHEMGHVRKFHLPIFFLLFIVFTMLVYDIGDLLKLVALSNRTILGWYLSPGEFGPSLSSLLSSLPIIILMVLYFRYIFGFFLRNSERQADLFAMQLLGDPMPLVSSFEKIAYRSGRTEDLPSWHHYSIRQRIDFLIRAFRDKDLIRKHNRKLYGSMALFVLLAGFMLFSLSKINGSAMAEGLRMEILLGATEYTLAQHPESAELQARYGGLLYERGRYSEAESVLRAALAHAPGDTSILNNLAWLYATAPPPYRNPEDALDLALEAAARSPEPHILDTLAEAYFINGMYREALEAIEEALSNDSPQRDYFLKQRDKFERALRAMTQSS